jgi:protein gp37
MGKKTGISWCDHTWNPWVGCTKVSAGCENCYMFRERSRFGFDPTEVMCTSSRTFKAPMSWNAPGRVFVCSWSDFFHPAADEWRTAAWRIIRSSPHLTFLILTKRPERIEKCLPVDWGDGWDRVWLGVSIECRTHICRGYILGEIPCKCRFVSYEPALEDLSSYLPWIFENYDYKWLISGGESGPGARPAANEWFFGAKDICRHYGLSFFHKQNGGTSKINGVWGGDELGGKVYHEFPNDIKSI